MNRKINCNFLREQDLVCQYNEGCPFTLEPCHEGVGKLWETAPSTSVLHPGIRGIWVDIFALLTLPFLGKVPCTHWIWGCIRFRTCLDAMQKKHTTVSIESSSHSVHPIRITLGNEVFMKTVVLVNLIVTEDFPEICCLHYVYSTLKVEAAASYEAVLPV
jgi:hypothetical protein